VLLTGSAELAVLSHVTFFFLPFGARAPDEEGCGGEERGSLCFSVVACFGVLGDSVTLFSPYCTI
jgi:hypothetical protein